MVSVLSAIMVIVLPVRVLMKSSRLPEYLLSSTTAWFAKSTIFSYASIAVDESRIWYLTDAATLSVP